MSKKVKIGSPEFKAMEKEWYGKLKDDGFIDIEDTTRANNPLKSWHNYRFKQIPSSKMETTRSYYDEVNDILLTHTFKTDLHRTIFELHCKGLSKRKIEKALASTQNPLKSTRIYMIIQEILQEAKKEQKKCQK